MADNIIQRTQICLYWWFKSFLFFVFVYVHKNPLHFIEKNESECIYDQFYSNNIISDKPLCIIRCAFKSIKSLQENGAVYIFIKNKYEQNIFFDNCSFIECYSKRGSGININLTKICPVQIYN